MDFWDWFQVGYSVFLAGAFLLVDRAAYARGRADERAAWLLWLKGKRNGLQDHLAGRKG